MSVSGYFILHAVIVTGIVSVLPNQDFLKFDFTKYLQTFRFSCWNRTKAKF